MISDQPCLVCPCREAQVTQGKCRPPSRILPRLNLHIHQTGAELAGVAVGIPWFPRTECMWQEAPTQWA